MYFKISNHQLYTYNYLSSKHNLWFLAQMEETGTASKLQQITPLIKKLIKSMHTQNK